MTGENGAKLHRIIEGLRREAEKHQAEALEIENAWAVGDVERLVELCALTRLEADQELPKVRDCICRDCVARVVGPVGTFCEACENADCPGYQRVPGRTQECRAYKPFVAERTSGIPASWLWMSLALLCILPMRVEAQQLTCVQQVARFGVANPYGAAQADRIEQEIKAVRDSITHIFDTLDVTELDTNLIQNYLNELTAGLLELRCVNAERGAEFGKRLAWWIAAVSKRLITEDQRRACVEYCASVPSCTLSCKVE